MGRADERAKQAAVAALLVSGRYAPWQCSLRLRAVGSGERAAVAALLVSGRCAPWQCSLRSRAVVISERQQTAPGGQNIYRQRKALYFPCPGGATYLANRVAVNGHGDR